MTRSSLIDDFLDNGKEDGRTAAVEEFAGTVVKHHGPESGGVETNVTGAALAEDTDESIDSLIGQSGV
jgi:hypothetical protein